MGKSRERRDHKQGRGSKDRLGLLPLTSSIEGLLREPGPGERDAFTPRGPSQARYASLIAAKPLVFGLGPAGVGKSYVAGTIAAEWLLEKRIERIIVTRPVVEAGEELGFLPGTMEEKGAPYFRPIRSVLERRLGRSHVEHLIKVGRIEFYPLAYMRGDTHERAFVILDEAQNTTPVQMKMFLTRLGEDVTCVVNGDLSQRDIPGPSGLADALDRLKHLGSVGVHRFTRADIVRSGLVQEIVEAYATPEEAKDEGEEDPAAGLQRVLAV